MIQCPFPKEDISHVFKFSSNEKSITYYHAALGLPTKEIQTGAIQAGNYYTWPGLNVKAVNK